MMTRQFEIYAPLQDFCWNRVDFELTPGLRIRHFNQKPAAPKFKITQFAGGQDRELVQREFVLAIAAGDETIYRNQQS